jgi:outer membrane protein OmpU
MHLEKGTFVMKKALYGTTALVAAAVVAGQADAASGLKLGITGYYRGAIGAAFGDSGSFGAFPSRGTGMYGKNNVAFRQEVRVNFTGSTTLDNGITVGVLVGLNAGGANAVTSNAPARINRAYMDISGKFGQVRFGDANSAYQSMCVGDPGNVTANFGLNSPNENFGNAGMSQRGGTGRGVYMPTTISGAGTCFGLETRSTKIIYFSPTFGGFNFAVSFTPDHVRSAGGSGGFGGTFGTGSPTGSGAAFHDFVSAGVNFNHDFGGVTLSAGVSGEWALGGKTTSTANAADLGNKPSMYQAGFQVGFGQFAVGASGQYVVNYLNAGYGQVKNAVTSFATSGDDAYMITVGGSYTMDAISIGLQGLYNHYSISSPVLPLFGGGDSATYIGASLNAAYALGPGISLEGQVAWTRSDTNVNTNSFGNDINAYEVDIGTAINF